MSLVLLVLEILLVVLLYYFVEPFKTKLKQHKLLFINAQIFFMAMLGLSLRSQSSPQSLLYETVAFMFGNFGTENKDFNGLLLLCLWLMPLGLGLTALSIIIKPFHDWITYHLAFFPPSKKPNIVVICGLGKHGTTLCEDIFAKNADKKVSDGNRVDLLVIFEHEQPHLLNQIKESAVRGKGFMNVIAIEEDPLHSQFLKNKKVSRIFLLSDNDLQNLAMLERLSALQVSPVEKTITAHIHLQHTENLQLISSKNQRKELTIRPFNIYTNVARCLFLTHQLGGNVDTITSDPENTPDEEKRHSLRICVVGANQLGLQIIHRILNLGHFYNGQPLQLTIFSTNPKQAEDDFYIQYPKLFRAAPAGETLKDYWLIEFKAIDEFYTNKTLLMKYHQIIFAYDDAQQNLFYANAILRNFAFELHQQIPEATGGQQIFIYVDQLSPNVITNGCSDIHQKTTGLSGGQSYQVHFFGHITEIMSYEFIAQEPINEMAKIANADYNEVNGYNNDKKTPEEQWNTLSFFTQSSNFFQAEHQLLKLAVINQLWSDTVIEHSDEQIRTLKNWYTHGKQDAWNSIEGSKEIYDHLGIAHLEKLAKVEKKRWNAFHYLHGWSLLPYDEKDESSKKKNEITKQHPCLVDWNRLGQLSEQHKKPYKGHDAQTILRCYSMVKNLTPFNNGFMKIQMDKFKAKFKA